MAMNRKYIQLTIEDLVATLDAVNFASLSYQTVSSIQRLINIEAALTEAITRARETPNASICLARAVERKNR